MVILRESKVGEIGPDVRGKGGRKICCEITTTSENDNGQSLSRRRLIAVSRVPRVFNLTL